MLGVLFKLTGGSLLAARLFQVGLGVGTVALVMRSTRAVFGERTALAAAWMLSLYGPALMAMGFLLKESLALHLTAWAVYLTLRAQDRTRQQTLAMEAARRTIEEMRNVNFRDVFREYNGFVGDDLAGPGTAPGSGFAVQGLGQSGQAIMRAVKHFERLVFRVLSMIMWLAPVGAFGAIAAVVGETGWSALVALGQIMLARRMGKTRIIAETGAGMHGVATATLCAKFGLPGVVYMGSVDVERRGGDDVIG